jgi:hypothetical protein
LDTSWYITSNRELSLGEKIMRKKESISHKCLANSKNRETCFINIIQSAKMKELKKFSSELDREIRLGETAKAEGFGEDDTSRTQRPWEKY